MASLVLGVVGAVIGYFVGGPSGAMYGFAIGSAVGGALFPGKLPDQTGPRLTDLKVQSSAYGGMIAIIYGRFRLAGNIIWAAPLEETTNTTTQGGKGGPSQTTTTYTYSATLAVSLCEGPIYAVRRIWADSTLVYDLTATDGAAQVAGSAAAITAGFSALVNGTDHMIDLGTNFIVYKGTETQLPDPTMEAAIGVGLVPAYRGQAYIVFSHFQLQDYGNRIPNFTFEVVKDGSLSFVVQNRLASAYDSDPLVVLTIEAHPFKYIDSKSAWDYTVGVYSIGEHFYRFQVRQILMDGTIGFSNDFSIAMDPIINRFWSAANGDGIYNPLSYTTDTEGGIFGYYVYNNITGGPGQPPLFTMVGVAVVMTDNQGSTVGTVFSIPDLSWPTPYAPSTDSAVNAQGAVFKGGLAIRAGQWLYIAQRYEQYGKAIYNFNLNLGGDLAPNPFAAIPGTAGKCVGAMAVFGGVLYLLTSAGYNFTTYAGANWVMESYNSENLTPITTFATGLNGAFPIQGLTAEGPDSFTVIQVNSVSPWSTSILPSTVWSVTSGGNTALGVYNIEYEETVPDFQIDAILNVEVKRINGSLWQSSGRVLKLLGQAMDANSIALSDIITDLTDRTDNLTGADIDVTELTDMVIGYGIATQNTIRSAIEPLQQAYFFDAIESDSIMKFVKRNGVSIATIPNDDLAAHLTTDQLPDILSVARQQEVELPKTLNVTFLNSDTDYETGTQSSSRTTVEAGMANSMQLAICMPANLAKQIADTTLIGTWVSRSTYMWQTNYKYAKYEPTDVITIGPYVLRIVSKDESMGIIKWQGVAEQGVVYGQPLIGVPSPPVKQTINFSPHTYLELMDIPMLRDSDNDAGFYFSACGSKGGTWPTAVLFRSNDGGANYTNIGAIPAAAPNGSATTVLGNFFSGDIFDELNSVTVRLNSGELSSLTELAVLNGANACLIGQEIVLYKNAVLQSAGVYKLTGLLRGQRGTVWAMGTHAVNETFVALAPGNTFRYADTTADIGIQFPYKGVTVADSITATNKELFTNHAQGLKPYAPVQLGGGRDASHNITINWVRCTRIGGEWRDNVDAGLGELTESYDVEVWDSTFTTLKRTFSALSSPTASYTSANQVTDFGSNQTTVYLRVYQNSAVVGRGNVLQGTL